MNNDIDVFIVTFNRPDFINAAIDSILGQTILPKSITIFDNGSEIDYINKLENQYGNSLNFFKNNINLSGRDLFEKIFKIVTSQFFIIFHDDDILCKNYIEAAQSVLKENENISLIGTTFIEFRNENNIAYNDVNNNFDFLLLNHTSFAKYLYEGNSFHFGASIYNKNYFKISEFDTISYGKIVDRPFVLGCTKEASALIFNFPFVFYRLHELQDSKTTGKTGPFLHEIVNLEKMYFKILFQNYNFKNYIIYFKNSFRYHVNNYHYLKAKSFFDKSYFAFLIHLIKNKATNIFCLIISFFYYYINIALKKVHGYSFNR
jgi:hypothetical protein